MKKKNWKIYYPLLIGIYAVIGLVSANIHQMRLLDGLRSLLVSICFVLACYALFSWRIKNEYKAALMCAVFFLFFFSYGHVYDAVEGRSVFGFMLGRHRYLILLWALLLTVSMWLIVRKNFELERVTSILNIIGIILLVLPLVQIARIEWQRDQFQQDGEATAEGLRFGPTVGEYLPDVYYIILDGYARDDILLQNYHLDISAFIIQLEDLGFYIPRCSQSNYGLTALSLSSALNMNTVDQILPDAVAHGDNIVAFNETIVHNLVRQNLEELGYQTVSFQNDIWWSQWSDADYYISIGNKPYDIITDFRQISKFEVLFLRTTALRGLEAAWNKWIFPLLPVKTPNERQADLIHLALDNLEIVPQLPSPKFVFAHIIAPHEPYVFSPDGQFVYTQAADPGYPNQIQYLNSRLIPLVQSIIAQSEIPPIIILQADHGRDPEVRLANFMAIFFPGDGANTLYPTLTPINIFRLMFNNYFGQDLQLMPDISYFSLYENTYDFSEIVYPCDAER